MAYRYDRDLVGAIDSLPKIDAENLPQLRAMVDQMVEHLPPFTPLSPLEIKDLSVPGPAEAPPVDVRTYRPMNAEPGLPVVLYIHSGGFTVGNLETEHSAAAQVAGEVGAFVVSIDYRLAPESPFPAATEDCYAVLTWVADNADMLKIDPLRIAVYGISSGASLAAALALMTRDRGGPQLCFQFLGVPVLDDRLTTPSMRLFTDTPLWDRHNAEASWRQYLGTDKGTEHDPAISPYAAPARATDLARLPPTYIYVCEFDPLRDEGLYYATRLVQAGVQTELHMYPGTFHGSTNIAAAPISQRMVAESLAVLARALA